jgi:type VI secretion system protein ImpM
MVNDDTRPGAPSSADTEPALRPAATGWWGKLPTQGDFVGQGLPPAWQQAWGDWLQRGLGLALERFGRDGLRARMHAMPPWQCLVVPAPEGGGAYWSGVVAPSADRVGRAFPMLLAEAYEDQPMSQARLGALRGRALRLADWLDQVGVLSSPEDFAAGALALAGEPWRSHGSTPADGAPPSTDDTGDALDHTTVERLRADHPRAGSFWWRPEPVGAVPTPRVEPWPPRDALVLEWLDATPGAAPDPPSASEDDAKPAV